MKRRPLLLCLPLVLICILTHTPVAFATSAEISVSGAEGEIQVSGSCQITCPEEHCGGVLRLFHNGALMGLIFVQDSGTYPAVVDGGLLSQGDHTFCAEAESFYGGDPDRACMTIAIDNTPHVTLNDPGKVEGLFDITGTATFKESSTDPDGHVAIFLPGGMYSKAYEGRNVTWKCSEIIGGMLDACAYAQGPHTVQVWAWAANGTPSEYASGSFVIDNTPLVSINDPGQVEGLFDITGSATFKACGSGPEGHIVLYSYEGMQSKSYEGTNITWKYSEIFGHLLDAKDFAPGTYKIQAVAWGGNGAPSDPANGSFTVAEVSTHKNLGAPPAWSCKTGSFIGNPINFSTGNKYQRERDLDLGAPGLPLGFSRYYNSQSTVTGVIGYGWTGTFSESLTFTTGKSILHQADGVEVHFIDDGQGKFICETDKVRVIEPVVGEGYRLSEPDGRCYGFDGTGKLVSIIDRNSNTQTLAYAAGKLASVEDNFGRRLEFAYDADGRLASLSTPIGNFAYSYDGAGNLTMVQKPDLTTRTYLYEDSNDPHNLTGIINERGIRSLTVEYDDHDRAVLSEGAGGAKRAAIVYDNNFVRHVTDSLGRTTTFKLHLEKGIARVKQSSGEGCASCLGSLGESYEFNERLYVIRETDAEGVLTTYTYDDRGNVLTRTEAVGTAEERTITYTYHPTLDLVTSITRASVANPGQSTIIAFSYDDRGNLLSRTETGFSGTDPLTRTITYTYNTLGQVTGIDGPRTDVPDVTALEYYPNTSDQGQDRGKLKKITDALGYETTFGQYNAFGRPLAVTYPNAVVSTYTCDAMGRIKSRTTVGLTSTFSYDEAGNLTLSRYPDGREFTYFHTAQGWLEKIQCVLGNSISYLYDTEGNRTREEVRDDQGTVLRYTDFEYDDRNRLTKTLYPDGTQEQRGYDQKGNLLNIVNQKGESTSFSYDSLNRLENIMQSGDVVTSYSYDKHDNLLSVTDAEGHTTTYNYDDLERRLHIFSPDTNVTAYTYDAAGNLVSKTDANGITAAYTYDVLNRLTGISFPDSRQNVSFTYDQGVNGKGRLTGMTDPSGTYTYAYDALGNLVTETRVLGGITFSTHYSYKQGGPLQTVTYPSGRVVSYERDAAGRVSRVTEALGGSTRTLVEKLSYLPFGPFKGLTYGNGLEEVREFDRMYRLTGLEVGGVEHRVYTLDPVGNIMAIANLLDPSRNQTFGYDSLGRLTSAQGIYGTETYTYDRVGNRLERTVNGQTETYAYESGTNRLKSITGLDPLSFTYDPNGNTLTMGDRSFAYNQDNRIIQASVAGTTAGAYLYNGKGERVRKTADGKSTLFLWDKDGKLIAEADEAGAILKEYMYVDGKLLAQVSTDAPTDTEVRVRTSKGRNLSGLQIYAFTQAGAYTGKNATTDAEGLAVFPCGTLADGNYKFRADYLSYQFWSPVIAVPAGNAADIAIQEETTEVTVTVAGDAKAGVKVYLFNGTGKYLGLSRTSDTQGRVFFDLPVGKSFKFRADYLGSQYWSTVVTIQAGIANNLSISTGGGSLTVTVRKDEASPLSGVKMYLFSSTGTYLGIWGTSGETGEVSYVLSGGNYKLRADYLGYPFWSDVIGVYGSTGVDFTIPHEEVRVKVEGDCNGSVEARERVNTYLFTPAGMYLNLSHVTDHEGHVIFNVPQKEYKVRADYLNQQYWSEVFNWQDKAITINEGMADMAVTNMGLPLEGINVYTFTATGTYLSLTQKTDMQGKVSFRLPQGNYKFRADYMGSQYWSGDTVLIPHVVNPIPISTGGGAFTLKVEKAPGVPLVGVNGYLFSASGAFLSQQGVSNARGEIGFNLADGAYKIRIDYLGYTFWTGVFTMPGASSLTHTIPHQNVTVTVLGEYSGIPEAKANVNTYLFTALGSYVNETLVTDAEGKVVFSVPPGEYKVRADHLGAQHWSEVFNQTNKNIVVNEGVADVNVKQNGGALGGVNVYVFSNAGTYLNLHGVSDGAGKVSFRLPEGTYRFRGDYQGSQFWVTEAIPASQVKTVNMDMGGGLFTLRVEKAAGVPLTDTPVYVFTPSGTYLNITAQTNAQGEVVFALASGWYRFRVDYMGYSFWCDSLDVPNTLSHTMSVPHRDNTITVNTFYTGAMAPLEGVKVYLFTESGSYLNQSCITDHDGHATFALPDQSYKVRVDYLGGQYWSEALRWQDREVVIDEGVVDLRVTWNGVEVSAAPVYLFTETGTYLNRSVKTDTQGRAQFQVPVKAYKFRIDYSGRQYWTGTITPIAHQALQIEIPLEQLALMPTNDPLCRRMDWSTEPKVSLYASHLTPHAARSLPPEGIKVASLGSLAGILSQSIVAQVAQPKVYYYITDHLGTPQKMVDSTGAIVWSGDYRPFGEVSNGVSTVQNAFRFPGQYYDQETGLHYNYHRYYEPKMGRYLTPDPIGLASGQNLFEYVQGDPLGRRDPMGLWPEWIHTRMIRGAFRGLSPELRQAIERGSKHIDEYENQHPKFAYMHAMRAKGQDPEIAHKLMNAFITDRLKRYQCELERGNSEEAFFALGEALHPIMDSTSPTHERFQWWDEFLAMPGWYSIFYHGLTEQWYLQSEMSRTVELILGTLRSYGIDFSKGL